MRDKKESGLLERYLNGKSTPQEQIRITKAYNALIADVEPNVDDYEKSYNRVLRRIKKDNAGIWSSKLKVWHKWFAYAAAVVLIIAGLKFSQIAQNTETAQTSKDKLSISQIRPGNNGAQLIVDGARPIPLSDKHRGMAFGFKSLMYLDGTPLKQSVVKAKDVQKITAFTNRGQTYLFNLPDGTRVWLNAESKLKFEIPFGKNERRIYLEGEAFFEVAKNKKLPFVVYSESQKVEVLGTRFNIRSYSDNVIKETTLLEGLVKLNGLQLKPDEQALQENGKIQIRDVDPSSSVGWVHGNFDYKNRSLEEIMKDVSRWYDIDVDFESEILKKKTFSGSISRYENIGELLAGLKYAGIKSEIRGKHITIIK